MYYLIKLKKKNKKKVKNKCFQGELHNYLLVPVKVIDKNRAIYRPLFTYHEITETNTHCKDVIKDRLQTYYDKEMYNNIEQISPATPPTTPESYELTNLIESIIYPPSKHTKELDELYDLSLIKNAWGLITKTDPTHNLLSAGLFLTTDQNMRTIPIKNLKNIDKTKFKRIKYALIPENTIKDIKSDLRINYTLRGYPLTHLIVKTNEKIYIIFLSGAYIELNNKPNPAVRKIITYEPEKKEALKTLNNLIMKTHFYEKIDNNTYRTGYNEMTYDPIKEEFELFITLPMTPDGKPFHSKKPLFLFEHLDINGKKTEYVKETFGKPTGYYSIIMKIPLKYMTPIHTNQFATRVVLAEKTLVNKNTTKLFNTIFIRTRKSKKPLTLPRGNELDYEFIFKLGKNYIAITPLTNAKISDENYRKEIFENIK